MLFGTDAPQPPMQMKDDNRHVAGTVLEYQSGARVPFTLTPGRFALFWFLYCLCSLVSLYATAVVAAITFAAADGGFVGFGLGGWILVTLWLVLEYMGGLAREARQNKVALAAGFFSCVPGFGVWVGYTLALRYFT